MATSKKRRVANRPSKKQGASKSSKKKVSSADEVVSARLWVRDAASVLIVGLGVFVLLGIGSHLQQLLFGFIPSRDGNLMGVVGHIVATVLFGLLGVAAFLPILGIVWFAFYRIGSDKVGDRLYPRTIVFLASLTLIVSFASLSSTILPSSYAGDLGLFTITLLRRGLGEGGTVVSLMFVLMVSLALVSQRSIGELSQALQRAGRWCLQTLFIAGPVFLVRAGLIILGFSWSVSQRIASNISRLFILRGPPPSPAENLGMPGDREFSIDEDSLVEEDVEDERDFVLEEEDDDEDDEDEDEYDEEVEEDDEESADFERFEPIIVKPKPRQSQDIKTLRNAREADSASSVLPQFDAYRAPEISLLTPEAEQEVGDDDDELRQKAEQIERKLKDFNIAGRVTQVHPGPVITLFEFEPAPGVKVGRIAALQDDLAMSLRASSIRIIAPLPKRGTVGIEVPNKSRAVVRLRDCLESQQFISAKSILSVPLGKDTYGDSVVVDIATMPHLLMAGATGTGKSVSINALLLSLLYRAHPSELGLILIDPKVLELSIYDGVPHLRVPVVTDPRQAKGVLLWAVKEMDRRYRYMQRFGVRNIDGYNRIVSGGTEDGDPLEEGLSTASQIQMFGDLESAAVSAGSDGESLEETEGVAAEVLQPMPKLVIVIDELADLMLSVGREIEELITRLAQKARAAGIHLIVATQRPSVDVITGLIKANFPARLSFRVSSRIDSRTILDSMGAEKLLGKGDMLFMLPGAVPLKRVHGAYVSDSEVQKVVNALKADCAPQYDQAILEACERALKEGSEDSNSGGKGDGGDDDYDPYYDRAVELVVEKGQASTSMIQRTFRIGYNRAARIIEMMEREGVVGKMDGARPREVLAPAGPSEP